MLQRVEGNHQIKVVVRQLNYFERGENDSNAKRLRALLCDRTVHFAFSDFHALLAQVMKQHPFGTANFENFSRRGDILQQLQFS